MAMAEVRGRINTRIILRGLYYLVVTPVGALRRRSADPLNRKMHDGAPSNWVTASSRGSRGRTGITSPPAGSALRPGLAHVLPRAPTPPRSCATPSTPSKPRLIDGAWTPNVPHQT
jgi:hypothetical protein